MSRAVWVKSWAGAAEGDSSTRSVPTLNPSGLAASMTEEPLHFQIKIAIICYLLIVFILDCLSHAMCALVLQECCRSS